MLEQVEASDQGTTPQRTRRFSSGPCSTAPPRHRTCLSALCTARLPLPLDVVYGYATGNTRPLPWLSSTRSSLGLLLVYVRAYVRACVGGDRYKTDPSQATTYFQNENKRERGGIGAGNGTSKDNPLSF